MLKHPSPVGERGTLRPALAREDLLNRLGFVVGRQPGEDFLGARLRELDQEKARRAALVEQGREREKTKQGEFDRLFKKVQEESGSGAPAPRPVRDVDLD